MIQVKDLNSKNLEEIHQIWISIMLMKPLELEKLLKGSIDYEDIGKEKFINRLRNRFLTHKNLGDSEFILDLVKCNGCKSLENVCRFTGNRSGKSFALYFDLKNNEIKDIFHCTWYGEMDFLDTF